MEILVVDVGGSYVKIRASSGEEIRRTPSGPTATPQQMVDRILELADGWHFDVITLGYPGEVRGGRPSLEPNHLGRGWVGFDFQSAFRRPVKIINDAAMQALGSYQGGRMLFLGLGTGLGSAMVVDDVVQPMELSRLPYKNGFNFGDFLRQSGKERLGLPAWRQEVAEVAILLRAALVADYVMMGGGNAHLLRGLPPHTRLGSNADAFEGGFRLWRDPEISV
jgi:polyphosphate glucokinase